MNSELLSQPVADRTPGPERDVLAEYFDCRQRALNGDRHSAEEGFLQLLERATDDAVRGRVHNDLGVLAATEGRWAIARRQFGLAASLIPDWAVPTENVRRMSNGVARSSFVQVGGERKTRVAVLSLLFNWPSSGGGTVHTYETVKFLNQAGYEVRHYFAQLPEWGLGDVAGAALLHAEAIKFTLDQWTVPNIQLQFRTVLRSFEPDWVIITDSWNSKPILAQAAMDHRFILRIAAQECLCPLNNIRLLSGRVGCHSCPKHQLATPSDCCQCVHENGKFSGVLHQAERELVSYGTNDYDDTLRWAFANAEAVLVVNPLIREMISPYAKKVCVVPSGFDSSRFPPWQISAAQRARPVRQILFAGLVDELMKGFQVIHDACRRLWSQRQDFELLATADPIGAVNEFTRYIGWQSQERLPEVMHEADILVFPTIAEEALGRTAVEAMGAGRPVVASRIGGLQFTVMDGTTGLLFESGNVDDLCKKLTRLLDDSSLCEQLGRSGRERFEEYYAWESIIARHYIPLLGEPTRANWRGADAAST